VPALAIRLRGAVKRYGPVTAVAGLDLDVPEGTCVGLLGPNGAGKSTTMRLLTAQAIADEGELEVLGHKLPDDSKSARAVMGVVPQLDNLDTTLTVEHNLLVFTYLYRVPAAERHDAIERALSIANLTDRRKSKVDELSGGMRRRLLIARALVHEPRLVLLDEPDGRPGPAGAPGALGADRPAAQRGRLDPDVDALHRGGRAARRHGHRDEPRQGCRRRAGRRSSSPSTPAARRSRSTARPRGCSRSRAEARERGWPTRRTGTSVTILRIDSLNGELPEGERRVATLEDVFVLLTGEEIA
jgi:lipooligosaccharide transport system ATP-binding protein